MTMLRAAVTGMGVWMPGFPNLAAWRADRPVPGADLPPSRQTSRLRRRTSLLIGMVAEVAAQASAEAGVSLSEIPIVVGSAFGELATTIEMLGEIEGDGLPSPLRFQNSVHNSAVGALSIAHRNQAPATSLAAGNDTVGMVLLEAMTLLAARGGEVLAIVADEPLPERLVPGQTGRAVSAALVLVDLTRPPAPPAGRVLAILEDLRQVTAPSPAEGRAVELDSPSAAVLPLLAAIAGKRPGRIELGAGAASRWSIALGAGDTA